MQITLFNPNFTISPKWYIFKNSTQFGAIYDTIDWDALTKLLPEKKTVRGAPSWLKPQGLFGLMFLKHLTGLSDEKLVDHFNTNFAMQMFCGTLLAENEMIKDNAFVSRTRAYLGKYLNLNQFQDILFAGWKGEIQSPTVLMMDATCYESYVRFPTDVKLLWESCQWLWEKKIPEFSKAGKLKTPKSKIKEIKAKYLAYSKLRKKSFRKTRKIRKTLLNLLLKGINAFQNIINQLKAKGLTTKDAEVFKTIKTVYQQQKLHFDNPKIKINNRIVSIFKPYLRPIVRGKENKPVEFGAKAHIMQVGGLNIVEHIGFDAFNECKRLKISTLKHKNRFGKCTHLAADGIYPTNENRRFVSSQKIQTNFVKKGKGVEDKQTKQVKGILNKERATKLEGSFGNEKNHYLLRKVKARTKATELVWITFGIMTANASKIANQRAKEKDKIKQTA